MIDREKVINYAEETLTNVLPDEKDTSGIMVNVGWIREVLYLLKEQEAVVRCKDCKECYFASNRIQSEQTFACGKHGIDVTQDWFCADGEKRE